MVSISCIEASAEIVSVLRRRVGGMAEDRLSNADMRGIPNRKLGRNNLSEEVRVSGSAELALRHRADATADPLSCELSATVADPKPVSSDWRCRTTQDLRPVMVEISFDPAKEDLGKRDFDRPPVLGLVRGKADPTYIGATLQVLVNGHRCDIPGSQCADAEDRDHQPVAEQQSSSASWQINLRFRALH